MAKDSRAADKRTDTLDEINRCYSKFFKRAYKNQLVTVIRRKGTCFFLCDTDATNKYTEREV
jgi:hypothetical protein